MSTMLSSALGPVHGIIPCESLVCGYAIFICAEKENPATSLRGNHRKYIEWLMLKKMATINRIKNGIQYHENLKESNCNVKQSENQCLLSSLVLSLTSDHTQSHCWVWSTYNHTQWCCHSVLKHPGVCFSITTAMRSLTTESYQKQGFQLLLVVLYDEKCVFVS